MLKFIQLYLHNLNLNLFPKSRFPSTGVLINENIKLQIGSFPSHLFAGHDSGTWFFISDELSELEPEIVLILSIIIQNVYRLILILFPHENQLNINV